LTKSNRLRPFFSYYGSKWRTAPKYPPPLESTIVEPFAGSAAYALFYPHRQVVLNDLNPKVAALWRFLIRATKEEILRIPLVATEEELKNVVPEEARILIGFWWGKALVEPATKPTGWLNENNPKYNVQYWGVSRRERIAKQVDKIKHWTVLEKPYGEVANQRATWFIDPPYKNDAGGAYVHGKNDIDYDKLRAWCEERQGQTIICENKGADWLPASGKQSILGEFKTARKRRSVEIFWTNQG